MYKYAKDGVTVSSVLDTRRAKKNGLFPVKIQVAYKRVQKYYPTGKELDTAEWKRLLRTRSGYLLEVRRDIGSSFDRIKRHVQELTEKEPFSFDALNRLLGRGKGDTLWDWQDSLVKPPIIIGSITFFSTLKSLMSL